MRSEHGDKWAAVEDELRSMLSQPLERLVTTEDRPLFIGVAQEWDIPQGDRFALGEWGLPQLPLFTPRPQAGTDPILVPNVAGEQERRLVKDGQQLYGLGFWGSSEDSFVVGVVPGDGRVLCLLPAPITVDDIPEVLRPYHACLHKPAVSFFSSSVAQRQPGAGTRRSRSSGRSRNPPTRLQKRTMSDTTTVSTHAWSM